LIKHSDLEKLMTSLVQLIAAAHAHARTESEGDLEGIMATMEGEPVYEFYPVGRRFRGVENTRRYYQHFVADFQHRISGYELLSESVGREGVAQEYTIQLTLPGASEPSAHRIMAILTFGERGITGERMYGDEPLFRAMLGPLWDETESLASRQ